MELFAKSFEELDTTELYEILKAIEAKMKYKKITMDAQKHAVGFYEKFGFKVTSDEFLEEQVVHVVMELV